MDIRVSGHQLATGSALQEHATDRLNGISEKYFSRALSSAVTFGKAPASAFACDIVLHANQGLVLKSRGQAQDAHQAFDQASDKIEKQLRRYKRRFHEHVVELLAFLGDSPLVAHNAQFDFGFLNYEFGVCGHPEVGLDRMIDTLGLARRRHPGAKHSLDALCTRYGVDRSHRVRHGALLDAELLAQVYVELTGGRQIGLALAAEVGAAAIEVAAFRPRQREFRAPRPHSASAEELARHKAFLQSLDSPLWAH